MTTELTIYQQITDPVSAIASIGKSIAMSQIFGCQNEAQGQVLALECMAKGLPPLALAEQYHLIQGKLSMKSDAMLGAFEAAGGEFQIKEYSPDACEIIFKRGKNSLTIRITWEEAQQEPWPWVVKNGQKSLKSTWASPIGRQDLLWARVVSRGVRRLAPGVVSGRYTPEEIQDFDSSNPPVSSGNVTKPAEAKAEQPAVVEAEFSVVEESPSDVTPLTDPTTIKGDISVSEDSPATEEMVSQIKEQAMFLEQQGIEVAVRLKEMLAKRGLKKLAELSKAEAEQLLGALKRKEIDEFFSGSFEKK